MNRISLAFPAAAGGTADTAWFLIRRPALFRTAPGRALSTVGFLALWLTLATRTAYEGNDPPTPSTLVLSGATFTGSVTILGVHLRHRIAGPRVFVSAVLSAIAFADCLRRRRSPAEAG